MGIIWVLYMISIAKTHSRKQLQKKLDSARKEFASAQEDLRDNSGKLAELEKVVSEARGRMNSARKTVVELSKQIQNVDITGAKGIKDRGDVKTYFIDDKEYHVDASDVNDIKMIPWNEYKKQKDTFGTEVDEGNPEKDITIAAFQSAFSAVKSVKG
jgi:TolA-binding protein